MTDRIPRVGELVRCVEGEAEVVKVLGRVSDGSRLLELRLSDRPKTPFFAAASNVLQKIDEAPPANPASAAFLLPSDALL